MKTAVAMTFHFILLLIRLSLPGGIRKVLAENLMIKQQLIVINRPQPRPRLCFVQRFLFGFFSTTMNRKRIIRCSVILSPETILKFHRALVTRKYQRLFSNKKTTTKAPGPKGPGLDVIKAIVEIKTKNPSFGCPRIADIINNTFALDIEKDVVRRVLIKHYRPKPGSSTLSWQAFIAHSKDSLWTIDLFRCESINLRSHWVLVVLDVYSRKIIGFGVHQRATDGFALRRMFVDATRGQIPKYVCHDNDPLFHSWYWQSFVGCLFFGDSSRELWSVPYTPISNPFVERVIGTIRREYLDQALFWNATDLETKLEKFREYYNCSRVHRSLCGQYPKQWSEEKEVQPADIKNYRWDSHCRGLFHTPVAA